MIDKYVYKIKKSKFIVDAKEIKSEQEAKDFIEEIKKKYKKARHNCYAYVAGDIYRSNDDGEPQGTAGPPILQSIQTNIKKDCVVVVTRYFGGILLGKGGLIRAYNKSIREALDSQK